MLKGPVLMGVRFALVACASLLLSAATVSAQSIWYITGSAGALLRQDNHQTTNFSNGLGATAPGTNTTTYGAGPTVNLGLGYRLPLGFRIEGELGFTHYTTDTASPLAVNGAFPLLNGTRLSRPSGGGHYQESATVNAFYDLPLLGWFDPFVAASDWLQPYIGGGVGYYHGVALTARFTEPGGLKTFTLLGRSSDNAILLAEVGLTVRLNDAWSIVPAYRFEHLFISGTSSAVNADIFKLGARYSF